MRKAITPVSGPKVLVVEDEPLIAFDLERILASMGCLVVGPAPSVAHALELLDREDVDFVILDVNLRRERATPVAEALLERSIPFALSTALGQDDLPEEPLRGAPLLGKPIDRWTLKSMLPCLLGGRPISGQNVVQREAMF